MFHDLGTYLVVVAIFIGVVCFGVGALFLFIVQSILT